jgi:uridine kinase
LGTFSTNKHDIEKDGSVYRIITDDPAKDASDFRKYSERISQIIVNSEARFTVGIFGGWGTGKTTIMKMIKKQLDQNQIEPTIISWNNIEQDLEKNKLIKFIKNIYKIDWIDNAECKKINDNILILEDSNNYNKFLKDKKGTYPTHHLNKISLHINKKK